jgi:tetratricopeptide (TPR) repeat protein
LKEKQRPKVDEVIRKCEDKKSKAAEAFKLGQYGEAVEHYKKAISSLESLIEDFPLFKREITQMEATLFNNIAVCCKKELNSKQEVEWTTKVIDRIEFIDDSNVILKAYLRRGLAYEQMEKFLQAREDMRSVREIQFDNKQASQCIERCNKAIKEIYGDKVPEVTKNPSFKKQSSPQSPSESPRPVTSSSGDK